MQTNGPKTGPVAAAGIGTDAARLRARAWPSRMRSELLASRGPWYNEPSMETPVDRNGAPDLSVCILSWNTRALLRRCLASIFHPDDSEVQEAIARAGFALAALRPAAAGTPRGGAPIPAGASSAAGPRDDALLEVIVVDIASADASAEMVAAEFPGVRLHRSPTNLGFPGGNNVGYRLSQGRYFMLLNSDTVVLPGALEELVAFADARPRAGIVGP